MIILGITKNTIFNEYNTREYVINKCYNYFFILFNRIKYHKHVDDITLFKCTDFKDSQEYSRSLHFAPLLRVRKLLNYLPEKYQKYNFIDIGSGKGIVMFFVLKNYNYNFIYGLEFEKNFVNEARENLKKYKNKFELIYSDAKTYIVPDKPFIVYLYNPFKEVILNEFINNNIKNFIQNKSVLIYHNDIHSENLRKRDIKKYNHIEEGLSIYFF